jgi:thioredoxin reductase (NADPH)
VNVVLRRFEATGHPMWRPYHERRMKLVWFDTISAASGRRGNVRPFIDVVGGGGDGRLEWLELRDRRTGEAETVSAAAVFVLIGARPNTDWLEGVVARDRWGYILTGDDITRHGAAWPDERAPLPVETSLPGVFAVGDVRHGSVKRVASAVGEGSIAVRSVHDYLALSTTRSQ